MCIRTVDHLYYTLCNKETIHADTIFVQLASGMKKKKEKKTDKKKKKKGNTWICQQTDGSQLRQNPYYSKTSRFKVSSSYFIML